VGFAWYEFRNKYVGSFYFSFYVLISLCLFLGMGCIGDKILACKEASILLLVTWPDSTTGSFLLGGEWRRKEVWVGAEERCSKY
jgi:hypothetical protein